MRHFKISLHGLRMVCLRQMLVCFFFQSGLVDVIADVSGSDHFINLACVSRLSRGGIEKLLGH